MPSKPGHDVGIEHRPRSTGPLRAGRELGIVECRHGGQVGDVPAPARKGPVIPDAGPDVSGVAPVGDDDRPVRGGPPGAADIPIEVPA